MLPPSLHHAGSITDLMEPAIDGPPSPESIRAISNQMRLASNSISSVASDKDKTTTTTTATTTTSHSSPGSSVRSRTSSSAAAADRPSWDLAASSASASASASISASTTSSLSRKSSGRSIVSTQQPRDSVQIFGKSIFGKRMRGRRESSAQSSSSSSVSVYSADADAAASMAPSPPFFTSAVYPRSTSGSGPAASRSRTRPPSSSGSATTFTSSSTTSPKDSFMPFFSRRRANTRNDTIAEVAESQTQATAQNRASKKLLISGPFNFQHLTSPTPRDEFILNRASVDADPLPFDGSTTFPPLPSASSSETLAVGDDAVLATVPRRSPMRAHAASVSAAFPTLRSLHHSRSQDQLRTAAMAPPPRPPRSPMEAPPSSFSPPVPPPRLSSRASLRSGDLDTVARTLGADRPRTSGGFRQPSPFSFSTPNVPRSPAMHAHSHSHSYSYSADLGAAPLDMRRFSQMPATTVTSPVALPAMPSPPATTHDDSNWPLAPSASASASASSTSFDILPGVPEEEEFVNPRSSTRRSRMSIASTASSLRKSHSLPLLQQFPSPPPMSPTQPAQPMSPMSPMSPTMARPPSAASDTLGTDVYAAQRSLRDLVKGSAAAARETDAGLDTSWEDDIDYCYEHEIEADCEYAWDRPSLDLSRDDVLAGMADMDAAHASPQLRLLGPAGYDMPALSPASHASTASMSEALTPTMAGGHNHHSSSSSFAMRRNPGLTIKTSASGGGDDRPVNKFLHARSSSRGSRASMFVEAQGFDLSPSLFIPGSDKYDCFRPPARRTPAGFAGFAIGADDDEVAEHVVVDDILPPYLDPATIINMDNKSMLYMPTRTSASSTTGSGASRDSVSVLSSHTSATSTMSTTSAISVTSAASTATDVSRLTMSTISTSSIEDLVFSKSAHRESMIIPQF